MSVELAESVRRSVHGPMWHGSPLGELLADVDHERAASRPLAGAHSIWEIVLHLAVWTDVARRRVLGERVTPTEAEDWPVPLQMNARTWSRDRRLVESSHEALAAVVSELAPDSLDSRVAGHEYTIRTLVHGVIEHDCYHGGQIGLLKKASDKE